MFRRTFTWEAKWTYAGLRFQTSVKTSSVHMKLHFKTTRYFDGHVQAHFISGSVYMIFYRSKWNFISLKMANMKSVPVLSFKGTCVLNATLNNNESALIHFVLGKLCSHENFMPVLNFISVKITDMKSIPFWVSFRLSSSEHM